MPGVPAFLFAAGEGGMLYLTLTHLVPTGQENHYQQSAAPDGGAGFLLILVLSSLV
jgi:zinc transporter ZupT